MDQSDPSNPESPDISRTGTPIPGSNIGQSPSFDYHDQQKLRYVSTSVSH